ncbi:MAG: FAD-dependent oxidoreductase [Polyangiaceae bacterium]|nr:FAD-dependent oxidoreductase [Polyangiaceae bacterium]
MTGLSFADAVNTDDYILCESLDDVGGYCQTVFQDGFVWDYSGHFFHFRNKDIEEELVSRIGKDRVRTINKDSRIYWRDHIIDFPFQKNIHQLPKDEFIECLVDVYEADQAQRDGQAPKNFGEMLSAKFGRATAEKFLIPYNEKLYATDLSSLDVDAMGRFFPYANFDDIIRGFRSSDNASYNSTFTYPDGGAIEYVRAVQSGVKPDNIRLNTAVTSIDLSKKVADTTNGTIEFETLVSSAPFPRLLDLCGVPYEPGTYSYNKVLVFNLGFNKKGPEKVHWMYFPQRDVCFYRAGFYDNIFNTERLSLYIEIGYPADGIVDNEVVERMRLQVLDDLKRCGIISDHELVSWHTITLDPAYVHITENSIKAVEQHKAKLSEHGVYSIGRYGSWTYCSIEDNIIEARALLDQLGARA